MAHQAPVGLSCHTLDIRQLADLLADPDVEMLFEIDNGGMRAFVCSGRHEGDFIAFQCSGTGDVFVVQSATDREDSVHHHARTVLAALR